LVIINFVFGKALSENLAVQYVIFSFTNWQQQVVLIFGTKYFLWIRVYLWQVGKVFRLYGTKVSKVVSIQKQNEGEVIDIKYYKKSE